MMRLIVTALFYPIIFLPTIVNAASEFPLLSAHYLEARKVADAPMESFDWYLTRRDQEVETHRANYSELWQRDARDELTLTRYFHPEHKRIQYTTGELRTQHRMQEWSTLNSVIDTRILSSLKRNGKLKILGRQAERYVGMVGKEKIEIIWLPRESLVAKYARVTRDERITLELKELRAIPDPQWSKVNADAENYDFIDGADLGDMEYDPFVARVLAQDGHHNR